MKAPLVLRLDETTGYGYVPVRIDSPGRNPVVERLLLDTGAAQTTLDATLANDLGIDLRALSQSPFSTAGGRADGWDWTPQSVELVGVRLVSPTLRFVLGLPVRGLLGNDLLRAAGLRAVVDVPKGRAVLAAHDLR